MQRLAIAIAIFLLGTFGVGFAQKAKTPPVKKKPAATGTAQLPGDNGKLGVVYAMGPKNDQLFFKLDSAALATRAVYAGSTVVAKAGEKLLVLTFTVQNPQKNDCLLRFDSFAFTCVAPDDQNWEFDGKIFNTATKQEISTDMKPAQKMTAVLAMPIHGTGPINKLMVMRGEAGVLRYDLRGKVKPLEGPFAANNGIDALAQGNGELGKLFALGNVDVTVEKIEATAPGGELEAEEGNEFTSAVVTITNNTLEPVFFRFDTLSALMRDSDGAEMEFRRMLLASSYRDLDGDIAPGASVHGRYVFAGPAGAKPTELVLTDPTSERSIKIKLP